MFRLLLLNLFLTGCYAEELQQELADEPFFDLAGYVDRQADSLRQAGTTVTKTIYLNGSTETKKMPGLNFTKDLRVFREADINKPAYRDKYAIERTEQGGELTRVYTATDSTMQTRRLTVVTRDSLPVHIEIFRKTGTVLSKGDHHLSYDPKKGYHIRTEQINRFGKDLDADIRVSW